MSPDQSGQCIAAPAISAAVDQAEHAGLCRQLPRRQTPGVPGDHPGELCLLGRHLEKVAAQTVRLSPGVAVRGIPALMQPLAPGSLLGAQDSATCALHLMLGQKHPDPVNKGRVVVVGRRRQAPIRHRQADAHGVQQSLDPAALGRVAGEAIHRLHHQQPRPVLVQGADRPVELQPLGQRLATADFIGVPLDDRHPVGGRPLLYTLALHRKAVFLPVGRGRDTQVGDRLGHVRRGFRAAGHGRSSGSGVASAAQRRTFPVMSAAMASQWGLWTLPIVTTRDTGGAVDRTTG